MPLVIYEQSPTDIEPAHIQPAAPAIDSRDSMARATPETLIRTDFAQNLSESLNRSPTNKRPLMQRSTTTAS
jgi:hypothetical protein